MSLPLFPFQAQPSALPRPSRQGNDPDWERLKDTICKLYANNKLKDVMRTMQDDYNFKASEKLYKTKIRDWGADSKNIKSSTYKAVLKKKREREHDAPGRPTKFQINGETLPDHKIEKWVARMLKEGKITENETFSEVGTPPGLIARTPTPSITSPSPVFESAVLRSPLFNSTISLTIQSPNLQSPFPFMTPGTELVSAPPLLPEPVHDVLPMELETQQMSRNPASLNTSDESSLLNNILSAFYSPCLSNGSRSSPVFDITGVTSGSEFSQLLSTSGIPPRSEEFPAPPHLSGSRNHLDFGNANIENRFEESISRLTQFANAKSEIICKGCGSEIGPDVGQELMLANSEVSAASKIAINCKGSIGLLGVIAPEIMIVQQRKEKSIRTRHGTFMVTTNKQQEIRLSYHNFESMGVSGNNSSEITTRIRFQPKDSHTMFTVSVSQIQTLYDSLSGIPGLIVNSILPKDSLVFRVAATGEVEDLLRLFATGKAGLHDHDIDGISLLHYAIKNPSMCQFLVQNGLDVDEFAKHEYKEGYPTTITPLLLATRRYLDRTTNILLEAGADPTLDSVGNINPLSSIVDMDNPLTDKNTTPDVHA